MSFYGCHFSFNGESCSQYGLMMYDFGQKSDTSNSLFTGVEIVEDRISRRYKPLHYGTIANKPLEFTMTFGADISAIDKNIHLDRWDMELVSRWLTSHNSYKWLEIEQPDMMLFRYKCIITDLQYTEVGNYPWAFTCHVICDSPYAYANETRDMFSTANIQSQIVDTKIYNKSSLRGYYKPKMTVTMYSGGSFTITNVTDNNRKFVLSGVPNRRCIFHIDNENEIRTANLAVSGLITQK